MSSSWRDALGGQEAAVYANGAQVSFSPYDFQIRFFLNLSASPNEEVGPPTAVGLVAMSPQHAKALSLILEENIAKYEEVAGEIKVLSPEEVRSRDE